MAATHLALAILTLQTLGNCGANFTGNSTTNPILDPKRRTHLVEEAFLEQKDILLDMLETKLKEVKDKKKKRADRSSDHVEPNKCDVLPKNVDLRLKAHGISAVGDADVQLKYGSSGNSTLNMDATGISNVGRARLDLTVGDGVVHIPGLDGLVIGQPFLSPCNKRSPKNDSTTNGYNDAKGIGSAVINDKALEANAIKNATNSDKDNIPIIKSDIEVFNNTSTHIGQGAGNNDLSNSTSHNVTNV